MKRNSVFGSGIGKYCIDLHKYNIAILLKRKKYTYLWLLCQGLNELLCACLFGLVCLNWSESYCSNSDLTDLTTRPRLFPSGFHIHSSMLHLWCEKRNTPTTGLRDKDPNHLIRPQMDNWKIF